ncbi:hypothetical protein ILUMI_00080 [Ignelater luminosus]|uniref:HTH psq-type domain-containing protein n=1 Tax=Ignelater luminosus TaxID=2038154 RepID=A0A8K0DH50_IGNLU|nr:hypothetical protein ILUMI_00080 [Ignelater luminosus]
MVRKYFKKKNEPGVSKETIKNAVSNVLQGAMSLRTAANTFDIKKSTLHDRVKKAKQQGALSDFGSESSKEESYGLSKYAARQVFSNTEEAELKITGSRPINRLIFTDENSVGAYAADRLYPKIKADLLSKMSLITVMNKTLDPSPYSARRTPINIISVQIIKPADVRPFPKAGARKTNRKSGLSKSRMYTSSLESPTVEELEKSRKLKLERIVTKKKIAVVKNKLGKATTTMNLNQKR